MEQITALSDEMDPTEWRNCGRGLAGWTDHNRVDAGLTRRGALLEEGAAASVEAANIRPSGFVSIGGWTLDLAAADGGCFILQT
ncbi:hypothetical protein EGO52_03625 [Curtobacterium flaccumfaciens]|nr:hypothetical protein [Curtobacterium flaccumfaciens]